MWFRVDRVVERWTEVVRPAVGIVSCHFLHFVDEIADGHFPTWKKIEIVVHRKGVWALLLVDVDNQTGVSVGR